MFLPRQISPSRRRAMILLTTLALLTLFAIVGITFVFYAQSSSTASLHYREADQKGFQQPDVAADVLMRWALNQLLYDVPDDATGIGSAMRGNSLARNVYGYNDQTLNVQPFNGTGALHYPTTISGAPVDDYNLINYTYFQSDPFVRDPERLGSRAGPVAPRGPFTGGINPPCTYPDRNALFVGASQGDGALMMPSFHRPNLFGTLSAANPNWTNTQGKYLTLRPRPLDMGPGFPMPVSAGGDVKNKIGAPGGEDSIWIDMNFPVTTSADGRKFKPLFAFYVEPIDGRTNVNASGNLMAGTGANRTHASNQGIGRWETNLSQVIPLADGSGIPEWVYIFYGNGGVGGRYGADTIPGTAGSMAQVSGKRSRFFSQFDWNAADETAGNGITGFLTLPGNTPPLDPFPRFPKGFGNKDVTTGAELGSHASIFDVLSPVNDDRLLPTDDMRKLLYDASDTTLIMSAELARLCPTNLTPGSAANNRRRNLVTTFSWDLNRMGLTPWLYDRNTSGYGFTPGATRPSGSATPFPGLGSRASGAPANSDFNSADWRAIDAVREKIDLAQILPPYPHQAGAGGAPLAGMNGYHDRFDAPLGAPTAMQQTAIQNAYAAAQGARQQLARQIYDRLLFVTGTAQPANPAAPTDPELQPRRYLAQIAVNIVDYIDEDEISTPFNFYSPQDGLPGGNVGDPAGTNATGEKVPKYWVFGTELPAIVLNEVMTEFQYPKDGTGAVTNGAFQVKVWAELHCPFPTPVVNGGIQPQDGQAIPFHIPAPAAPTQPYSVYDISIANTNTNPLGPLYPIEQNVLGAPDAVRTANRFTAPTTGNVGNAGAGVPTGIDPATNSFFIAGAPGGDRDGTIKAPRVPANTPLWESKSMLYDVMYTGPGTDMWQDAAGNNIDDRPAGLTVVLRRLANPHMPPNDDATNPLYNPYVTVDYIERNPLNNATMAGSTYKSLGKLQPYAAERTAQIQPQDQPPLMASPVLHTFGLTNSPAPAAGKYDWLVHLDREPTSPIELLQVAEGRPHQLTQRFVTGAGPHQHRVPWFDEDLAAAFPNRSHRLSRLLAHLTVGDRGAGVSPYGRTPGKVNINMIFEPEVLLALLDPTNNASRNNYFTSAEIYNPAAPWDPATVWGKFLALRSPGMVPPGNPPAAPPGFVGAFTPNDRPFWELDAGLRTGDPQGDRNINDTLFRSASNADGSTPRLFQSTAPQTQGHPYLQMEMLNKLANNVTTRSNTFAVWCTVGFFQVIQDTDAAGNPLYPVKLGPEVNAGTGNEIRHRFFAIVDRTQFVIADYLALNSALIGPNPAAPQWMTVAPSASPPATSTGLSGTISYYGTAAPVAWQIVPGSVVVIDRGTALEETVLVTSIDPPNSRFQAVFRRPHNQGAKITMHGNPGPQQFNLFFPTSPLNGPVLPVAVVTQ